MVVTGVVWVRAFALNHRPSIAQPGIKQRFFSGLSTISGNGQPRRFAAERGKRQITFGENVRSLRRFLGARLCEPQHARTSRRFNSFPTRSVWRSCCGSQTRAPPGTRAPSRLRPPKVGGRPHDASPVRLAGLARTSRRSSSRYFSAAVTARGSVSRSMSESRGALGSFRYANELQSCCGSQTRAPEARPDRGSVSRSTPKSFRRAAV